MDRVLHGFQHIFGREAFVGQLRLAFRFFQFEVDFAFKLQLLKGLHAPNHHIAVTVLGEEHRLRGFMDGLGYVGKIVPKIGNRSDKIHTITSGNHFSIIVIKSQEGVRMIPFESEMIQFTP